MEHKYNGLIYTEIDKKAEVGDLVISSEQIGQPRVYEVYHTYTDSKVVLGRYSLGHCSLSQYKVVRLKD